MRGITAQEGRASDAVGGPFRRKVGEASDAHAMREPAIDGACSELATDNRLVGSSSPPSPPLSLQAGTLLSAQSTRLIIVWLEVRILPAPPHSPIQTEISRCLANSAELVGFRAGALSLLTIGLSVIGLFDAAVSAP